MAQENININGGTYLGRRRKDDSEDDLRLDKQYMLAKEFFFGGHVIHPVVLARIPVNAVADLGCGTAAWLKDVWLTHGQQTNMTLVGWDINSSGFPHLAQSNIQLYEWDCSKPISSQWHGKFDLVNIGILAYAIERTKWQGLLQNAYKLLRPGGYLEWRDSESQHWVALDGPPEIGRGLSLWHEERKEKNMVEYMPSFMLSSVISNIKLSSGEIACPYQVVEYRVDCSHTPESYRGRSRADFVECDKMVAKVTRAMLQGRLNRYIERAKAGSESEQRQLQEHIDELTRLIAAMARVEESGEVAIECKFPHLLVKKMV